MGNYHGEEGFRELSHAKTVFKRHRFFPIELFYPPYGSFVQNLALNFFLGRGDPDLCITSHDTPIPAHATHPASHDIPN